MTYDVILYNNYTPRTYVIDHRLGDELFGH